MAIGGCLLVRDQLVMAVSGIATMPNSITPNPTNSPPGLLENITAAPIISWIQVGKNTKNINFMISEPAG